MKNRGKKWGMEEAIRIQEENLKQFKIDHPDKCAIFRDKNNKTCCEVFLDGKKDVVRLITVRPRTTNDFYFQMKDKSGEKNEHLYYARKMKYAGVFYYFANTGYLMFINTTKEAMYYFEKALRIAGKSRQVEQDDGTITEGITISKFWLIDYLDYTKEKCYLEFNKKVAPKKIEKTKPMTADELRDHLLYD